MDTFCFLVGSVLVFIAGAKAGSAETMVAALFFFTGTLGQIRTKGD